MESNQPKRFLSVRVSQAEFQEIQRQYKFSGCISLTQYAKKVLMNKQGARSRELIAYLNFVIERLNKLEGMLDEKIDETGLQDIVNLKRETRQFVAKWVR
jgi:hypothetical protein